MAAEQNLAFNAGSVQNSGLISAQSGLTLNSDSTLSNQGEISTSSGDLSVTAKGDLDNSQGKILNANGSLILQSAALSNKGGAIESTDTLKINVKNYSSDKDSILTTDKDLIFKNENHFDNDGLLGGITNTIIETTSFINNAHGQILSNSGDISIKANSLTNAGLINSDKGHIGIDIAQDATNSGSIFASSQNMEINAQSLSNSGLISAHSGLTLNSDSTLSNQGEISTSSGNLSVTAKGDLDNNHGKILNADGTLTLNSAALSNKTGTIESAGNLNAIIANYNSNKDSVLTANETLSLKVNKSFNNEGLVGGINGTSLQTSQLINGSEGQFLATSGDVTVKADSLTNAGLINSDKGRIDVDIAQDATNSGSIFASSQDVNFKAGSLNNSGLISAQSGLSLNSDSTLSNQGEISTSSGNLSVTAKEDLDNSQGKILNADGNLTLQSATLSNQAGTIESAGNLNATIANYNSNKESVLTANKTLSLKVNSAFNNEGLVGGIDGTSLQTSQFINSSQGQFLATTGDVTIKADSLTNAGNIRSEKGHVSADITNDATNSGTVVAAERDVNFEAGAVNNSGTIASLNGMHIKSKSTIANHNGQISTNNGTLLITANNDLDNSQGKILDANGDLTLQSASLSNQAGAIESAGNLNADITNYGSDKNSTLSAQKLLNITSSEQIDNEGLIAGGTGAIITGGTLLNGGDATLVTINGDLGLTLSHDVHNNGLIRTQNDQSNLSLSADSLDNKSDILSQGEQHLSLHGEMNNQGRIRSEKSLNMAVEGKGENTGLLFSIKSMILSFKELFSNNSGQIGTKEDFVTIKSGQLDNQNGKIIAQGGALDIQNQNDATNDKGVLQSDGRLSFSTGDLSNNGGLILSTADHVALNARRISNQNGNIRSNGDLTAYLTQYDSDQNSALSAQGNLVVTSSGAIDNEGVMGGILGTEIKASQLNNGLRGQLISTKGGINLDIINDGTLNNDGIIETLVAGHTLRINAGTLHNNNSILSSDIFTGNINTDLYNKGVIYSTNDFSLNLQGTLNNEGQISNDNGTLDLNARAINNQSQIFTSGSDLKVQTSSIANDNGQIQSAGFLTVQSDRLSNQHGTLLADKNITIRTAITDQPLTEFNNNQGIIQAGQELNATASYLDNRNGTLLALGGNLTFNNDVSLTSDAQLHNESGSLKASGDLHLRTSQWQDNAQSVVSAGQTLSFTAAGLMENNGTIIAGHDLTFTAGGLDNKAASGGQGGLIASQNGAMHFSLNGSEGLNNAGHIETQQQNLTRSSAPSLDIQSQGPVHNEGELLSLGSLSLSSDGSIDNSGKIGALGGNLTLKGHSLTNKGNIASSGQANLTASDTLLNNGQIYGVNGLTANSDKITNNQGQMSAQKSVSITGSTLDNSNGTIISGQDALLINIADLTNNQNGIIQGAGPLTIQNTTLDNHDNGRIISTADSLNIRTSKISNQNGILQAQRDIALYIDDLDNSNNGFINAITGSFALTGNTNQATRSVYNNNAIIQAQHDLSLTTDNFEGLGGKLLQQDQTGSLILTAANNSALNLNADDNSLHAKGNLTLKAHSLGNLTQILAGNALDVETEGDITNNILFQSGGDASLHLSGNCIIQPGYGLLAGGNATINAASITNNGALMAQSGLLNIQSNQYITNNALIMGQAISLTLPGQLTNQKGAIEAQSGSIFIGGINGAEAGDVINRGGLISADSNKSDIEIHASSLKNIYDGTITNKKESKELAFTTKGSGGGEYKVPKGLLDKNGNQGTGYITIKAVKRKPKKNRGGSSLSEDSTTYELTGTSSLISAGRDIKVTTSGGIDNDASHIAAGGNILLQGGNLKNIGYVNEKIFYLFCNDHKGCRWDSKNSSIPFTDADGNLINENGFAKKGHRQAKAQWGPTAHSASNATGSIVAGGDIVGKLTGDIDNVTKIEHAKKGSHPSFSGEKPDGLNAVSAGDISATKAGAVNSANALPDFQGGGLPSVTASAATQKASTTLPGFTAETDLSNNSQIDGVKQGQLPANYVPTLPTINNTAPSEGKGPQPPPINNTKPSQGTSLPSAGSGVTAPPGTNIPGLPSAGSGVTAPPGTNIPGLPSAGSGITAPPGTNIPGLPSAGSGITAPPGTNIPGLPSAGSGATIPAGTNISGLPSASGGNNTTSGTAHPIAPPTGSDVTAHPGANNPGLPSANNEHNHSSGGATIASPTIPAPSPGAMTPPAMATPILPTSSISQVVNAIPGGSALFVPNPSPQAHYVIETNPRYSSLQGLYGSSYLLKRLSHNKADYAFLGDNGFDTRYVQQQIVSATGQTFLGANYQTANDQMRNLLDAGTKEAQQQGLEFGVALTAEQQKKLKENIVWYVPVIIDGKTVLAPKVYLSPDQAVITDGGTISGKNVSLTGRSVHNSGTINASDNLALTSTEGDIVNAGGTLSGGTVALNAIKGSIINESQLNTYQIAGGTQQDVSSTGHIISKGSALLTAQKDIHFSGSSLTAGGDTTLLAGNGITLDAAVTSATQAISYHHYRHTADATKNTGSSVITGGDLTMGAIGGDLNLAASGILAGGSASLTAKKNITLGSRTDSSSSYTRTKSTGFLSKKVVTTSTSSSTEIGSLVGAKGNITIAAGHDLSVAGTVSGGNNVSLIAGNKIETSGLQDSFSSYYHKKKSGLGASFKGGMLSVGYGKTKNTQTTDATSWTASQITAGKGDLSVAAGGAIQFKGTDLSAGHDLSVSGSSVGFDTLLNSSKQTQKLSSSFLGLKAGLSSDSAAGQAQQSAQAANNMSGKDSAAGQTLNAMQAGYDIGKSAFDYLNGNHTTLAGISASLGFNKSKSYAEQKESHILGSSAIAQNKLSVVARGDNKDDANNGTLKAVAAQIAGKDVSLSGQNIILQSGWNTSDQHSTSKQSGISAGAELNFGTSGFELSAVGNTQQAKQKANGHSATSVDTTISATHNVTINAPGHTVLHGAEVNGDQVSINTGHLDITSPQNSSRYKSSTKQGGLNASIPASGFDMASGGASFANQTIKDNYLSTGKKLSGIYAGKGGVDIHVAHETHLKAGLLRARLIAPKIISIPKSS
ncbi:hemagglutinin repeat-containing protein [Aristophania vespae]|uniref:hemagglutinin repeat-containing protein n=1 Tax=Aristophania vespae TaxID=2697033 RepID=UPI0038D13986